MQNLENLLNVIQKSYSVQTHEDYCKWLQQSVQAIIRHDALLACWGSYGRSRTNNKLNYDLASAIPNFKSSMLLNHLSDADLFMNNLHKTWCQNNKCWFIINDLQKLPDNHPLKPAFLLNENNLNAFLVYGVSDFHNNSDCMYVFFAQQREFQIQHFSTGYIMPHIDSVLRRIERINQTDGSVLSTIDLMFSTLTKKEFQVLDLLRLSKSNKEISRSLNISPNTTKAHLRQIFRKLNVEKRMQAVTVYNKYSEK